MDQKLSKSLLINKHIMAIDYGKRFTGVATYRYKNDPFPLTWGRIPYIKDDLALLRDLKAIIIDEFIDILVIGVPHFTDGKESTMTKTIKSFVDLAKTELFLDIYTVDETLTTFEAEQRMLNDPKYNFQVDLKRIDELSAAVILEQFVKNSSD